MSVKYPLWRSINRQRREITRVYTMTIFFCVYNVDSSGEGLFLDEFELLWYCNFGVAEG